MTDSSHENAQGRWHDYQFRRAHWQEWKAYVGLVCIDSTCHHVQDRLTELVAEADALKAELTALRDWAQQVHDALDGRALPDGYDEAPARIAALRAEKEQAKKKLVCQFYPNTPCPLPNVQCSAPDCKVPLSALA